MNKYIEIIDGKIMESNSIHPYNDRANRKQIQNQMRDIFFQDLKNEFPLLTIIREAGKIISVNLYQGSATLHFYIDHVDSGGNTTSSDIPLNYNKISKKVSIDFPNKEFRKNLKLKEPIYIVNFYFTLRNTDNSLTVDYNKYCYIIVNYKTIKESSVMQAAENDFENINPTSRWIKICEILDFINNHSSHSTIVRGKNDNIISLIKPGFMTEFFLKNDYDFPDEKKYKRLHHEIEYSTGKYAELLRDIDEINNQSCEETTKKRLIDCRLGQGEFRNDLMKLYDNQCILSGIKHKNILVASHILPWHMCGNLERLDKYNGLLLSSSIDKLFDAFEISFNNEGTLVMSDNVNIDLLLKIGIKDEFLTNSIFPKLNAKVLNYLKKHYEIFVRKNHQSIK